MKSNGIHMSSLSFFFFSKNWKMLSGPELTLHAHEAMPINSSPASP